MHRRVRNQSFAALLTYVAAWISGPFVVLCVEKDGSSHFEFAFAECCGNKTVSEAIGSEVQAPRASSVEERDDGDCTDCVDFAMTTPAVRIIKSASLDAALAGPLLSPGRPWKTPFDCSRGNAGLIPDVDFLPQSELPRAGICVLQI